MWNRPTQDELKRVPELYQSEHIPVQDKIIHMHFFFGGCDWYVAEFDGNDLFFGYAILNGDIQNAEWGYFALSELESICICGLEVDRDLQWQRTRFSEIPQIRSYYAS